MDKLYKEMERWLIQYKKNDVKYASYIRLTGSLHLLGKYSISSVPPDYLVLDDVQSYINGLIESGYSLETIKKQVKILREYLTYAYLSGYIKTPLYLGIKSPKEINVKKHKKTVRVYTREEQRRLTSALMCGETIYHKLGLLLLDTGMRIGEAMALQWTDIDMERKSVTVTKTIVRSLYGKSGYIQIMPKTKSSKRELPLSGRVLDSLLNDEVDSDSDELIFVNRNGDPCSYDMVKRGIRSICKEADVPFYGLHAFRHTFATNCFHKGCDVQLLSKMLGHSKTSITYDRYVHLYGDSLEKMRSLVN